MARRTTWTFTRDTGLGVNFAGVNFYDGQGFIVRKALGLKTAKDLDGAVICTVVGTTTEANLSDFFKTNDMELRTRHYESGSNEGYEAGLCDALTNDRSALAAIRTIFANPGEHVILPETISKEPPGPAVRHGDDQWFDIVKWTGLP